MSINPEKQQSDITQISAHLFGIAHSGIIAEILDCDDYAHDPRNWTLDWRIYATLSDLFQALIPQGHTMPHRRHIPLPIAFDYMPTNYHGDQFLQHEFDYENHHLIVFEVARQKGTSTQLIFHGIPSEGWMRLSPLTESLDLSAVREQTTVITSRVPLDELKVAVSSLQQKNGIYYI